MNLPSGQPSNPSAMPNRPAQAAIRIHDLSKSFQNESPILDQFHLEVWEHEILCILGPSGCGKSTLLRLIAGLEEPTSGQIEFPTQDNSAKIAYVFQHANLLPWRSSYDNIALPLQLAKKSKDTIRKEVFRSLELVDLPENIAKKLPSTLSGGMQMRVSLARAIVTSPRILLLDEPFGALDEVLRHRLCEDLRRWAKERGWTILFVTHSVSEAAFLSTRTLLLGASGKPVGDFPNPITEHRDDSTRHTQPFVQYSAQLSNKLRNLSKQETVE